MAELVKGGILLMARNGSHKVKLAAMSNWVDVSRAQLQDSHSGGSEHSVEISGSEYLNAAQNTLRAFLASADQNVSSQSGSYHHVNPPQLSYHETNPQQSPYQINPEHSPYKLNPQHSPYRINP
ncbi:hypothetical protein D8674_018507 [Pyrus ussuriensis x Pyrus communis]|uniref:K Homology domain-containing protein n=1 Tax=Pyrus ussuriensis x Pyrus communis TaxID=2448454 RepID=A0A5N5G500_9ROSA|nr:hypothetical protein D8674_018507 [Pyrus ussuriensis x Pyrus communis]